jgi:hypothetical protein
MTPVDTVKAAYAAFDRNDPSVLFGALDPAVSWNEAEGNPLADRNPCVGAQAIGSVPRSATSSASATPGSCRSSSTPTRRSGRG